MDPLSSLTRFGQQQEAEVTAGLEPRPGEAPCVSLVPLSLCHHQEGYVWVWCSFWEEDERHLELSKATLPAQLRSDSRLDPHSELSLTSLDQPARRFITRERVPENQKCPGETNAAP